MDESEPQAERSGLTGQASLAASTSYAHSHEDDGEDEVVERARADSRRQRRRPAGRYSRYRQVAGAGRFKTVYKGFDEKQGIDVAWSKIEGVQNELSREAMLRIEEEVKKGLEFDHPNCHQVWYDEEANAINMVTEFFTGGNLREYRQRSRQLGMQAVKKWTRQILQGLAYLHKQGVVHGDLRPDKIYIHGHSGEIKIGDKGLPQLVPKRFAPGIMPEGDPTNQYTRSVDIFAFGLVILELATNRRLHTKDSDGGPSSSAADWEDVLATVQDGDTRAFVARCLAPPDQRPSAAELLEAPFLRQKPPEQPKPPLQPQDSDLQRSMQLQKSRSDAALAKVRGEDYLFRFTGKVREGKHHFRLQMEYDGDAEPGEEEPHGTSKTIDFVFDHEVDTADEIAAEISNEFNLSITDRDICAAALKEWLDRMADAGAEGASPR
eukprot:scaffold1.g5539.t1